jgi:ribosomal protein L37E
LPYVTCEQCGLVSFSVARWLTVDYCGQCGAELPRRGRRMPAAIHELQVEYAVRESLYGDPPNGVLSVEPSGGSSHGAR